MNDCIPEIHHGDTVEVVLRGRVEKKGSGTYFTLGSGTTADSVTPAAEHVQSIRVIERAFNPKQGDTIRTSHELCRLPKETLIRNNTTGQVFQVTETRGGCKKIGEEYRYNLNTFYGPYTILWLP